MPKHIYPTNYKIILEPDFESFTFSGKETIDIVVLKNTKEIILHSKDIKIETVEIFYDKKQEFAKNISYDIKREIAKFTFKNLVPKGKVSLVIVFEGIINDHLRGFYRSKYEVDGQVKHIATTQFEPTDARRAFPCFDEPSHKATFEVSLTIREGHMAISNTISGSIRQHEGGYKIVDFVPTPKMSTYLLAFIIGEFEYIEGKTKSEVKIRVLTTRGKSHQAKFALDVAKKALEFYDDYFDIPYPLPILDLVAIPDFESAAMENWGAITFRETAILVDEDHSSLSNKQWVAIVIAHEIAHQWFGNLVTMEWWTDLWLNEGFASYMENLCVDKLFPSWYIWDLYLADRYGVALRLDSLENSHPIEIEVHHPDEISEIFDMVSYSKGSAVIRMLANYIGEKSFRDGLRHYLKKHSYKNTKTEELWKSFEKVSGKPVKKIMGVWTRKTGYPLISFINERASSKISQQRFFSSRISAIKNNTVSIWPTPLEIKTTGGERKILLNKKIELFKNTHISRSSATGGSFIRARYDSKTLWGIKGDILKNKLQTVDRLSVVRDLFALAEGGYIKTSVALDFALIYKDESEFIVWSEIASGINKIYNLIVSDKGMAEYTKKYDRYALSLFSPLVKKTGWVKKRGEENKNTFLRSLAISQAAFYGDKKVIASAKKIFMDRNKKTIDPDIRSAVYASVASSGNNNDWNNFARLYEDEQMHEEKERFGRALTKFKNKKLLAKTLQFSLSKKVRTQDAPFILGSTWASLHGRDQSWKFVKKNWKVLLNKYGEGGHFLSRLISPLEAHTKIKDLQGAKKFFAKNSAPGANRTIEQAYERIASNVAWLAEDKEDIKEYLSKKF